MQASRKTEFLFRNTFNITVVTAAAIDGQKIGDALPGEKWVMPDVTMVIHSLFAVGDKRLMAKWLRATKI